MINAEHNEYHPPDVLNLTRVHPGGGKGEKEKADEAAFKAFMHSHEITRNSRQASDSAKKRSHEDQNPPPNPSIDLSPSPPSSPVGLAAGSSEPLSSPVPRASSPALNPLLSPSSFPPLSGSDPPLSDPPPCSPPPILTRSQSKGLLDGPPARGKPPLALIIQKEAAKDVANGTQSTLNFSSKSRGGKSKK